MKLLSDMKFHMYYLYIVNLKHVGVTLYTRDLCQMFLKVGVFSSN